MSLLLALSASVTNTTTPVVVAGFTWQAVAFVPVIEQIQQIESIGNYAGYDQHVRLVRAARKWEAHAARPFVQAPLHPTLVHRAGARMAWTAKATRPIGLLLIRQTAPAALIRFSTGRAQLIRETAAPTLKRSQ